MNTGTITLCLQDKADTATRMDLDADMVLISKKVQLFDVPGFDVTGYDDRVA